MHTATAAGDIYSRSLRAVCVVGMLVRRGIAAELVDGYAVIQTSIEADTTCTWGRQRTWLIISFLRVCMTSRTEAVVSMEIEIFVSLFKASFNPRILIAIVSTELNGMLSETFSGTDTLAHSISKYYTPKKIYPLQP